MNDSHTAQLVIFDLDGTLLNSIGDLAASTNYALKNNGYPQHELPEYRYFVGNGITKLIERALPEDARDEKTVMRLRGEFVTYYQVHKTDLTHPYEGIPELLKKLHAAGIKLAVASNKYQQGTEELIAHFFGDELFSVVLGQRENVPTKPDPTIIHEILSQTGVSAENTLYVGDSGVDMQTAKNGSLTSIGVSWGFRSREELKENQASHIVDQPDEIAKIAGLG